MEFFRDTHIDFMRYRRFWIVVSAVLLLGTIVFDATARLNYGIEFVGGTQITVQFSDQPQVDELRSLLTAGGVPEVSIQRFGERDDNAVMIKTPLTAEADEGARPLIVSLLREHLGGTGDRFDVNDEGSQALADLLLRLDPDQLRAADEAEAERHYGEVADAVGEVKRDLGILTSWDQLSGGAISPETLAALRDSAAFGPFTVIGAENVWPQISSELRSRGIMAVVLAILGMLVYIWLRFELRFGIGAVVALVHDVLITLGLFALAGLEFNLTTVAGFLTLVGYSVNDTVVVFDRVRENLRQNRRGTLVEVFNESLNQTLSRTVLTSGTTLLVVGCLLAWGGDVLRGFSFILTVGILIGTYSSIYIASPFALLWESWFGAEARSRRRAA